MTTYTFIEEHDLILNNHIYFTRKDGFLVSGSMRQNKDEAYQIFSNLVKTSQLAPADNEKILLTVTTP